MTAGKEIVVGLIYASVNPVSGVLHASYLNSANEKSLKVAKFY